MMQRRRHFCSAATAALLVLVLALVGGAASAGRAATPTVVFTLTGSPTAVTPGKSIGFSGKITNTGALALPSLVLVESIPGVGPLQFKSFSRSVACGDLSGGGIKCTLGALAAGASITFTTVFPLPASTQLTDVVNTATVSTGHDSVTASASQHVLPTDTTAKVGGYLGWPGAQHEIATNHTFSASNPHASTVAVPLVATGVGVGIREGSGTTDPDDPSAPPSFFQCPGSPSGCIGQWTFVGIPETQPPTQTPFTQTNPFEVLVFFSRFEQHLTSLERFALYKNGVQVTDTCPFDEGSTVCVKSVTIDSAGTIVADLLETVNGYIGGGG